MDQATVQTKSICDEIKNGLKGGCVFACLVLHSTWYCCMIAKSCALAPTTANIVLYLLSGISRSKQIQGRFKRRSWVRGNTPPAQHVEYNRRETWRFCGQPWRCKRCMLYPRSKTFRVRTVEARASSTPRNEVVCTPPTRRRRLLQVENSAYNTPTLIAWL